MHKNAKKNIIYSIVLLIVVFLVYLYRQRDPSPQQPPSSQNQRMVLSGATMGTTYRVVYLDKENRDFKQGIDSVLRVFNQSLSTYIPDSEISRFNQVDSVNFTLPYFYPVLEASREVFENTEGAFDPTVGPLVNAWGFGPEGASRRDSSEIKELLRLVSFDYVDYDSAGARKLRTGIKLDFSAIAKGYGVDVVAAYLQAKGISNMLVEIGGELVARGQNENGELWRVGVSQPDEEGKAEELYSIIALDNQALATSGNYRNFYEEEGQKFSHTISPFTGYPVRHGLLSATVLAKDCMRADAYATAMMVIGTEASIQLQEDVDDLEVLLIFNNEEGQLQSYISKGLEPYITMLPDNIENAPSE
jgi:thiamine biosynthesis lipoprotein